MLKFGTMRESRRTLYMSPEHSVDIMRTSLLVRWRPIFYPFEHWKFLKLLPEIGYVVPEEIRNRRMAFGSRPEISGVVATKGAVSLTLDSGKPGIQVDGTDLVSTFDEFQNLEELINSSFGLRSEEMARFYEFDAQALVRSTGSPIKLVGDFKVENDMSDIVSGVLNYSVNPFSFKVVRAEGRPSDDEWCEFFLEPSSRSPESDFFAYLIFRQPDRTKVLTVAQGFTGLLEQIIEKIENS